MTSKTLQSDLKPFHKIHMAGIGGIGMSGIAELLLASGKEVSGSDLRTSDIVRHLEAKGVQVHIGHSADLVAEKDLLIHTSAIREDNPELTAAREAGIPVMDRAEALGLIMKGFKERIAVSGAHGKTTTTAMIALILEAAALDPTVLVGGVVDELAGNVKVGRQDFFVTEACEYRENFLKFHPTLELILNIDEDHLDYFRDLKHIMEAFGRFADCLPKKGVLVANFDDYNVRVICSETDKRLISYGISQEADYRAVNIVYNDKGRPSFEVLRHGAFYGRFDLSIPGRHNIYNSLAAIAACDACGVEPAAVQSCLNRFKTPHRRFETRHQAKGVTIIDDYAHHPNEIKATLEAAVKVPHRKIWGIFQPHTFTRTKALLNDFATAFGKADRIVITDIYAAREENSGQVHSSDLARLISEEGGEAQYVSAFEDVAAYVAERVESGDIVLTMGAGDVYKIGDLLAEALSD